MVSDPPGLSNGARPASSSNSTHPNAQMSVRRSTSSPRVCSGLMCPTVPITTPGAVSAPIVVSAP